MNETFPELNKKQWSEAHESSSPHGMKGLSKAMELMTVSIANARSSIGTQVGYLNNKISDLNKRLDDFNSSSEKLSRKALLLTWWIMAATVVSAAATAVMAIDIIIKWSK